MLDYSTGQNQLKDIYNYVTCLKSFWRYISLDLSTRNIIYRGWVFIFLNKFIDLLNDLTNEHLV